MGLDFHCRQAINRGLLWWHNAHTCFHHRTAEEQRRGVCARAVICFIIYFVMGFFGAARWGLATDGNLLVNEWGPSAYQGILNILLGSEYPPLTSPHSGSLCTILFSSY